MGLLARTVPDTRSRCPGQYVVELDRGKHHQQIPGRVWMRILKKLEELNYTSRDATTVL